MNVRQAVAAAVLTLGTAWVGLSATAHASPQSDDPGWHCATSGVHTCSPTNPEGAPAGEYDQQGRFVRPWTPDMYGWLPEWYAQQRAHSNGDGTYTFPNGAVWDHGYLRSLQQRATGPAAYDEGAYVGGYN